MKFNAFLGIAIAVGFGFEVGNLLSRGRSPEKQTLLDSFFARAETLIG
ncbi:hypothetical protein [Nostoc sp. LPT]|nr:hypothetical protein [Nostoc sp. LPT]MBN4002888.1 hypothetical protein [Nostoc sp. LPT]